MNRLITRMTRRYADANRRRPQSRKIQQLVLWLSAVGLGFSAAIPATAQAPKAVDFQRVTVAEGLDLPMEFEISADGRAFVVSKCGKFYGWKLEGGTATQTATVPNVRCVFEDGLLSLALDPNFTQNNYLYVQYTAPGSKTRVSRFTVNANNGLNTASESILLEWTTGNEAHGHMGGSLKFDKGGNLIITTGDNNAASGYFSAGAQATSGNTNDLRGKVLRITPTADGKYTIPAGNLFPADATHRAEIYGMGFRNPFRINIDPLTGYLYVGDIGPDASADSAEGPGGLDELNELRTAGNYGWPHIIGYNQPYAGFNPNNIVNNYVTNTGAKNLPPAKPALWTIRHQATMAGPVYRFNEAIKNDFKLPAYYDGRLIFWDFNSSKFFTINLAAGANPPVAEEFPLNTGGVQGAIDAELDPRTQQLYVLQWGSGCCDKEPFNNGVLYRFDYIGGRDNGTNLSLGSVATATSAVGGNAAAYAVDGDPTTRWESAASDPQTLTIDLRQDTKIATIVLKWEAAFSSKYVIEASTNGTTWEVLVNEPNGTGSTKLHMINSTKAYRYVRLTGTARGTNYGHSLFEFEVYAGTDTLPEEPLTQYAYLNMPKTLDAAFTGVPKLLSQTGAFSNTANMTPSTNLLPFAPNSQLWSDNAAKSRWISIPATKKVKWDAKNNWVYPEGTVVVKHFALPTNATNPAITKRLETRLIVVKADGKIYGVTYKWRADNSDADLLTAGQLETINITNANGTTGTQTWAYPSPTECMDCHNAQSAQILGLSTRQLNGNFTYPNGVTENQLVRWNNLGLFSPAFNNTQVATFDKMAALTDTSASLETRIKSYLDANCAHCHGTGQGGSQWDARFNTPLAQMQIVNQNTTGIRNYQNDYGIANAKVIAAGKPLESILYIRDKSTNTNDRMPPIGRLTEHKEYIDLLNQWITSLANTTPQEKVLLSRGKPVTVSTFEGGFTGVNAVDGNAQTRWGSEFADPQWIEIDLQAAYNISEIRLQWEAAYGKNYVLEGSLDRTGWTPIVNKTNGTGGLEVHSATGKYRYIRLTGTARGTVWGYSLFEFEVWGGTDVPAQTPTITLATPAAGQQFVQGSAVNLQVAVSDANWFTAGGRYRYTLDANAAVTVATANPVNLGALAVGAHSISVQLYNAAGQAVGTAKTASFSVTSTSTTPVLISQGKTVTTSAVIGGNNGAAAVDGNMGTRWESIFADNQYIQIDLGSKMAINRVLLEWEAAYGKGYYIEVSDNATQWTEIYRTTTGNGAQDDLAVSGQGRYIRLTGTVRGTQYGFSLWEFRVYGSPVDVVTTPTISVTAPTAGQQFVQGTSVSLQVAISDSAWFTSGGSYRYSLNGGAAVRVANATAVNLGALAVGNHAVQVTLLNAQNQAVGASSTVNFSVRTTGTNPTTPSPAKLTPVGATASSFVGAGTAAAAIDGNVATRWESATSDPQYIQLDLGKSTYFTRVVLNWEAAYSKAYTIDVSENGTDWTNAYTTTNGDGGIDDLVLDGQRGRYIRMRGTVRATGYGHSLFEFDTYGVAADSNPALVSFVSPAADAVIPQTQAVTFQVGISDANWIANGGGYNYYLDANAAVRVNNLNAVNLGLLPTGQHTLKVSLVDSRGVEVSVPKIRKFRVSCGTTCPKVLVFSKTAGFRHDSIAAGIAMIQQIGAANGYSVTATEDSTVFTTANLAQYSTIVFLNTTGDIFNASQEAAFKTYMETGGGFVGTHAAADTEHDWDWYTDTLFAGAEFIHHGDGIPRARVVIEKPGNDLVKHIGTEWFMADEWYFWKTNPRNNGTVEVLGTLDRSSYTSNYPVADHPIIFTNRIGTGRMFYTAIGHVDANFADAKTVEMIRKAIEWTSAD